MVVIFTLEDCFHCIELKKKLKNSSISYNEIEITKHQDLWVNVVNDVKNDTVPLILITNNEFNTSSVYIPGIHYQNDDEFIEILKELI